MTDQQIILRMQAGDERALDAAIEAYSRLLWSIARAILQNIGSTEDMEECVADAFIQLWRNRGIIDQSRGGVKAWLCTVTKSRAIDCYRKAIRKNEISMDEQLCSFGMEVLDQTLDTVLQRELLAAVHALGEPDQQILLRRYYYQQKPREISLAVDMTVRQVENRLYRIKQQLKKQLEGEQPCKE